MDGKKEGQSEMSLTLKYLLENPSLLQPPEEWEEEKCKEEKSTEQNQQGNDLTSAYLGPQIWSDMLLSDDLRLEPVNLDEFLDPSGTDDEMSDLNMLMSSSPTISTVQNEIQQRSPGDSAHVTYQDMPQLMSAHTAADVKQVPSPTDYFCLPNTMKSPCQQLPACSNNQQMRMMQMQQQQQLMNNQPVYHKYTMSEQQVGQCEYLPFSNTHQNNPYNSNPQQMSQNLSPNMPPLQNTPAKRPRQASASSMMQHPSPQQQLPVSYPNALTRQLSNKAVYGQRQQLHAGASPSQLSPSSRARTSPVSPIEVHIPSPKKINYIPNNADVVISTPQQDTEETSLFDPSTRTFTEDELKPQPIIRKSKKVHVAADNKDGKYWNRRNKNNVAAKRSREARRIKENQIAMRASYLEQENSALKTEVVELRKELTRVVEQVKKYEERFPRIHN